MYRLKNYFKMVKKNGKVEIEMVDKQNQQVNI